MTTAATTLRRNAVNVRRLVPDKGWAVLFIALALAYPYILE